MSSFYFYIVIPGLDSFFRDKVTGKLRKELIFIVDNGPTEQPSSPMVQMGLVRFLRFFKLNKVTQVSFAENHSKRNYVERVHAEENRWLSKHGVFKTNCVHSNATAGSEEHRQNIEHMEAEAVQCLNHASFGAILFSASEA